MDQFLLSPPVAFVVMLAVVLLFAWAVKGLALKPKVHPDGLTKSYACGEDIPDAMIQPDYGQFVPFAFFFTILHVVALVVTTAPVAGSVAFVLAVGYILCAVVGLTVLYTR